MVIPVGCIGCGASGKALITELLQTRDYSVIACDKEDSVYRAIRANGIRYEGILGSGVVRPRITRDYQELVAAASVIFVTTTASSHDDVASQLAPYLPKNVVIVLCPGYVGGVLLFRRALQSLGACGDVLIAETSNSLHLAAAPELDRVFIKGRKGWFGIGSDRPGRELELIEKVGPILRGGEPVPGAFGAGLVNLNPIEHVAAYLLNVGSDRSSGILPDEGTLYFAELLTPEVRNLISRVDSERLDVARALQLGVPSRAEISELTYPTGSILTKGIPRFGPKLLARFIHEDVPCGLVPIEALGLEMGCPTPAISLLITLAGWLCDIDFRAVGRSVVRSESSWQK